MSDSLIERIVKTKNTLPKKQKAFCEFVLENYREIGLDSVNELSKKASVGTTTVLRTISALGYESFQEFKKDLHNFLMDLEKPVWWDFNSKDSSLSVIEKSWNDINELQKITLNENLVVGINKTVELIKDSTRINVLGLRTSTVAAVYFENLINAFYPKVTQLSHDSHFIMEKIYHMQKGEILIIFALSPFTKLTLDAAKYCYELGHPIILVTDSHENSVVPFSDVVLYTYRAKKQYTIVPVISLIETITLALGNEVENSNKILDDIGKLLVKSNITTL